MEIAVHVYSLSGGHTLHTDVAEDLDAQLSTDSLCMFI